MSAPDDRKPRLQSPTERELRSEAARKTQPRGVPIVVDVVPRHEFDGPPPITGVLAGEELYEKRRERLPGDRVEHVEIRVDNVVESIGTLRTDMTNSLATVTSAVGALSGEVKGLATVVNDSRTRERETFSIGVEREKTKLVVKRTKWEIIKAWSAPVAAVVLAVLHGVRSCHGG